MINTILFDLDGTLLPMNLDKFLHNYFMALGKHLKDYVDPKKLTGIMMEATAKMINNTQPISNQEVFMKEFSKLVEGDGLFYLEKFHEFYDTLFQEVKSTTWKNEDIIKSVEILKEKGYNLVIATNPVFPMRANKHRIKWAGINYEDFNYITSFEDNFFCKPNLEFYHEVLSKINKLPQECMMVGNDDFEDTVARKIGIKTYLITDCLASNELKESIEPNHKGTYSDFLEFVKGLNKINN